MSFQEIVHFDNRSELNLNFRLLLSDIFKSNHDISQAINIFCWLFNFKSDLLNIVRKMVKHDLGSPVEIHCVSFFPVFDPLLETNLGIFSLKTKSTNLMESWDSVNFFLKFLEFIQFLFKVLKLWISGIELLQVLIDLFLPEPIKLFKALEESSNVVLGTLNWTCKKQNNLDNFLVLGNPVIEWFSIFFRLIFLIPVLDMLSGFKNSTGSSINGSLDLIKRWFQITGVSYKSYIYFKEWLQNLLWHISSSTNSLFHLIKRILSSMKKCLIHWPIVIFGELLNFLSWDWFNVLIKLVRAYCLYEILNCSFNFIVLWLEL